MIPPRSLLLAVAVTLAMLAGCSGDEEPAVVDPQIDSLLPSPSRTARPAPSLTATPLPSPLPAPSPLPTAEPATPTEPPPTLQPAPPPALPARPAPQPAADGSAAQVIWKGDAGQNVVAFSFDAGSDVGYTALILDTLAANGIRAASG